MWKKTIRFFRNEKTLNTSNMSDPITVRLPESLLDEINAQSQEIGGDRYRSKHLITLLELGVKYYRVNSETVSNLPVQQIDLITRLHYVFNTLNLKAESVSEKLGHKDLNTVAKWLIGSEIPTFDELDLFSEIYFINENWLKHGSNTKHEFTPFQVVEKDFTNWKDELTELIQPIWGEKTSTSYKPYALSIIRAENGSVIISVAYNDAINCKHVRSFHYTDIKLLDDNIRNPELERLVQFALLCKFLYGRNNKSVGAMSYNISDEEMSQLISGECLPFHFKISGQSRALPWFESIFDYGDTVRNKDAYWDGAFELFKRIQHTSSFLEAVENDFKK